MKFKLTKGSAQYPSIYQTGRQKTTSFSMTSGPAIMEAMNILNLCCKNHW